MPTYEGSGTENLRGQQTIKSSSPISSPSADGKPAGGTENLGTTTVTKRAAINSTPSKSKNSPMPQHFNDDAV